MKTHTKKDGNEDITPWVAGFVVHRLNNTVGPIAVFVRLLHEQCIEPFERQGNLNTEYFRQRLETVKSGAQLALEEVNHDLAPWIVQPVRSQLQVMLGTILVKTETIGNELEGRLPSAAHLAQELDEIGDLAEDILRIIRRMRIPKNGDTVAGTGETTGLSGLISEAIDRSAIPQNVDLITNLTDQSLLVSGHRGIVEILINVLTNAVEAMPNGGQLRVTLCLSEDHQQVEIRIADTGCGIPEHLKSVLFEPFVSTKERGQGIGLWLSRQLILRLGGNIYLEHSKVGEGSTFVLTLPINMGTTGEDGINE